MLGFPAGFVVIFLLCQLTGPAASGAVKKLVGALGGSVTFPLNFSVDSIDSIVWIFNTTTLITIAPKMADENALIIVTQQRNKERVDFPNGNYSLKLSKLKKNDSGAYRAEIHSSSIQSPLTQDYELRVYEQLSKPKVTIDLQNSTNGTCITNLTCSMEQGGEDVTYSWKSLGQTTNESHSGSVLPISWRGEKRDMTFICMARNPISSNSSTPIFAWKLCEGAAGGLASSVIFSLLLFFIPLCSLALMLIILILRRERKEFIEEKREIDPRLEILNYYPPSGETLEYDTIPDLNNTIPEENPVNSIYSTVQISTKALRKKSKDSS
ncbi:SLAM family member 7 isoform X2 [Camelus dromedarius]|uniref:SLAM family member 7 isoform X2 n=2 Tax=Camelus TaxID=9836 RepID=A0A8B8RPD0_CAMFR|nr:SLAM family member 7 isoform X2 [Camelus dromedarius]XP_032319796.1 SLAM family member 7 isoform X2 [Camelus ferus]XP_045373093.1 SLAM family member 7 isoform X2 [Camelus bactrianus]